MVNKRPVSEGVRGVVARRNHQGEVTDGKTSLSGRLRSCMAVGWGLGSQEGRGQGPEGRPEWA